MTFDPMEGAKVDVYRLHERPELLRSAAELLNSEWPRSLAAREASIAGSCDDLPCSLLLVSREGGEVVGHAHILPVAGWRDAALVESVVVTGTLRGRGLGRLLMGSSESHARRMGCKTLHLSTHDQQEFYSHLGYSPGPAVSALRRCLGHLMEDQTGLLMGRIGGQTGDASPESSSPPSTPNTSAVSPVSPAPDPGLLAVPIAPPPPPPPPPPKLSSGYQKHVAAQTWMMKVL